MTKAMPFLQKVILLSYDPRLFLGGFFYTQKRFPKTAPNF
ncbi:unknown [Clostridium sp. CAG:169]|nr:unknown [Clostridium sp. CAG:169]